MDSGNAISKRKEANPLEEFLGRCRELEAKVLRAQRSDPENASWLSAIWHYAVQQASSGNQHSADQALAQLAQLLKE